MVTVDIVSPLGGDVGGVENVILKWTKYIDHERINLRIFHCYKGGKYLQGYEKQYSVDKDYDEADLNHLANAYATFIQGYGAPDICIATNWPMMVYACAYVRQEMKLFNMKIISWIHNSLSIYNDEGLGGAVETSNADEHLCISHDIAEDILRVKPDAIVHEIGNPVDFRDIPDDEVDPYMLTYVGRLTYIKHVDIILEAMYRASAKWKLRIIGDGEIRKEVEGWIKLLKLKKRVELLGWNEDPWSLCRDSRILVMASEYEGFPMTACEAASQGKTIITTPVQGVTDYIIKGETGYFVPFEDAQGMANVLNLIEKGKLSICDPAACRKSVERYETKTYFENVMKVLLA